MMCKPTGASQQANAFYLRCTTHAFSRLQSLALVLLLAAMQDPNVCQKTATFCRFMIPGLFPWSIVTILIKVSPFLLRMTFAAIMNIYSACVCRSSQHLRFADAGLLTAHCLLMTACNSLQ